MDTHASDEAEFAVKRAHLQEPLTVAQIEAREAVEDPLRAVPNVPFGHLNAAWKTFIVGVAADDELWSFTARWEMAWAGKAIRSGYVIVRGGVPGSYFLTVLREVEEGPEGDARSTADANRPRSSR
jgi:hypothetical protein